MTQFLVQVSLFLTQYQLFFPWDKLLGKFLDF